MKKLRLIFDFYIKSSIHLSICLLAFCTVSYITLEIDISFLILLSSFAATLVIYNYIKFFADNPIIEHEQTLSKKLIKTITIIFLIILMSVIPFLNFITVAIGLAIFTFTIAYVIPIFGLKKNLRNLGGIKVLIVAICWSATSVLVPIAESQLFLDQKSIIVFFQRIFLIFACTIPFEIRDLKYDLSALQTIPQVYGIQKTKFLAILSLIIFLIFSFHLHYENSVIFFSELMVSMFVACLVIFSEKQQKKYFSSFFVESVPIVWVGFTIVFRHLLD